MKSLLSKADRRAQRKIQKQLAERYGNTRPVPEDEIVDWMEYQFRGRSGYRYLTIGMPDSLITSTDERNGLSVVWLHDELPTLKDNRYESKRQLPVICLLLDRKRGPQQGLVYDHYQQRYAVGNDLTEWHELDDLRAGRPPAFAIMPAPMDLLQTSAEASFQELSAKMTSLKQEMVGTLRDMMLETDTNNLKLSESLQDKMSTVDGSIKQFSKLLAKNEQHSKRNLQELEELVSSLPEFIRPKREEIPVVNLDEPEVQEVDNTGKVVIEGSYTVVE